MNLEQVLAEWATDSNLPRTELDEVSRQTPALHAKYLALLSNAKLRMKKTEMDQKILLKKKWLWYNGKMTEEQIKELGWEYDPLEGLKVMKGEMDYYYDSDKEIQESELRIQYLKTMIDTLNEIVNNLNWRHQTIGNMIKWKVFEAGG
ncbi:recombination mediator protein UvsY [Gammaproteobacteria bacterium]|nr:recombination mediator protein UvsY [Gammaproteobacteria bacterium]|tara:strand:- start:155 stop:598 length:444 start_codon:yes stop_codon:yes gene_type:complete